MLYKTSTLLRLALLCIVFFPSTVFALYTAIWDSNFEQHLIDSGIDSEGILDGQVPTADIAIVSFLNVRYLNISTMRGIEDFTNLTVLWCEGNQLTDLDLSDNTALEKLRCYDNQLTSLDLSNNPLLEELR